MRNRMKRALIFGFAALLLAAFATAPDAALAGGGKELRLKVNMINSGVDTNAKGKAEFRERIDRMRFKVQAQNLDAGTYDVLVAHAFEGNLVVGTSGKGELEFRTNPEPDENKIPLTFDPRGQVVEIAQGATIFLSVVMPTGSLADLLSKNNKKNNKKSGSKTPRIEIELDLVSTGDIAGADGKIRFRSKRGRDRVRVEIEDVPDGDYTFLVGGIDEGTIVVTQNEGELEFDTQAKNDKLPLNFDPRGQLIEVLQDGTVILQVVFPLS